MKKTLFLAVLTALATACAPKEQPIEIVPYPNSIEMKAGTFMAAGADLHMDPAMEEYAKDAVRNFAADLALASGQAGEVTEAGGSQGFTFKVNPDIQQEGYRLRITGKKAVAEASDLNGFIYAIQTLKQMLPVEIYGDTPADEEDWTLPCWAEAVRTPCSIRRQLEQGVLTASAFLLLARKGPLQTLTGWGEEGGSYQSLGMQVNEPPPQP